MTELVVPERRDEQAAAGEARKLDRSDRAASTRLLPGLRGMNDLTGQRDPLDTRKLNPLDMPDHGDLHGQILLGSGLGLRRSGMGPVAQPVFKTGAAWQPHARSVRLRRRSVDRPTD